MVFFKKIKVKFIYSTTIDNRAEKRRKKPSDSRYGSVETCRNIASLSSAAVRAHAKMVGVLRVVSVWQL